MEVKALKVSWRHVLRECHEKPWWLNSYSNFSGSRSVFQKWEFAEFDQNTELESTKQSKAGSSSKKFIFSYSLSTSSSSSELQSSAQPPQFTVSPSHHFPANSLPFSILNNVNFLEHCIMFTADILTFWASMHMVWPSTIVTFHLIPVTKLNCNTTLIPHHYQIENVMCTLELLGFSSFQSQEMWCVGHILCVPALKCYGFAVFFLELLWEIGNRYSHFLIVFLLIVWIGSVNFWH